MSGGDEETSRVGFVQQGSCLVYATVPDTDASSPAQASRAPDPMHNASLMALHGEKNKLLFVVFVCLSSSSMCETCSMYKINEFKDFFSLSLSLSPPPLGVAGHTAAWRLCGGAPPERSKYSSSLHSRGRRW